MTLLLYSTTNHLERLDTALSRPGRMDVWVEFKNASKWQAEALFRNFFPSTDQDNEVLLAEGDIEGIELPTTPPLGPLQSPTSSSPSQSSTLWSLSPSFSSSTSSLASAKDASPQKPPRDGFGARNQAYLPPPVEEHLTACQHSAKPLDGIRLAQLAKMFADSIPDDEFSVAALQGCEYLRILWYPMCFDVPFHRDFLGLLWAGW